MQTFAHRGYLVTYNSIRECYIITKDGYYIATTYTALDAVATIDALLD